MRELGIDRMIPFVDLKAHYAPIKEEVNEAIQRVLDNCQYTLGPEVAAFESEFAAYCNVRHAIGVNSGTSALHLALLSAGVGPGDEVITVPFTFVATVSAIHCTGARPIFVDIVPRTFTMNVDDVERAVAEKTKAIVPVHLYGHPADMDPLLAIGRRHGLAVIEDAAQAHGPCTTAGELAASATWAASASIRARTWAPMAKAAWSPPTMLTMPGG